MSAKNKSKPNRPRKGEIGTLHEPKSTILRVHAGNASEGKRKYDLATTLAGCPVIQSHQTGKWFSLSWRDILSLAQQSGIDS